MNKVLDRALGYIDSWLRLRYESNGIPGMQVAIAHQGKLVLNKAFGEADLATHEKLTTQHVFRIASHSKIFTATALMQLAEQGTLRLDDPVALYVPWLAAHSDKRFRHITIRQIASHGAGIIRDGLDADYWQLTRPFPDAPTFKKEMLKARLVLNNNLKFKYSNFGFTVLGEVIASASGQTWGDYVTEHIIRPLGLTHMGPDYTPAVDKQLATGYGRELLGRRIPFAKALDTRAMGAATGFYSNAADLCQYMSAHIVGSGTLLNDESKKEMQRPQWKVNNSENTDEYGLGLAIAYIKDNQVFGHSGGFPGYITRTLCDPEHGLTVSVLTNAVDGPAGRFTRGIFSIIYEFLAYAAERPAHDLASFEGRFMFEYDTWDIVALGKKLVSVQADTPFPFSATEELERVDATTLRIAKEQHSMSDALGELVHYDFAKNGSVRSIRFGGFTMLPEKVFLTREARRQRIG